MYKKNSTAEAKSRAEARSIELQSAVEKAKLITEAKKKEAETKLAIEDSRRIAILDFMEQKNKLQVSFANEMAAIENKKLQAIIGIIGNENLQKMAIGENEMKANLLKDLNLESQLITNPNKTINLFDIANTLISDSKKPTLAISFVLCISFIFFHLLLFCDLYCFYVCKKAKKNIVNIDLCVCVYIF